MVDILITPLLSLSLPLSSPVELYENIERVGQSVKYHLVEGIRNMWNQLNELARAHTSNAPITAAAATNEETDSVAG